MIKVRIHGIEDGLHNISEDEPTAKIKELMPQFFGDVHFEGKLRKLGKRYSVTGFAQCKAKLICDLSLEEYEETISTELSVSFIADTDLFNLQGEIVEPNPSSERVVHEDDQYFDLTEDIKEQLSVALPMKCVSPKYRDKSFEELHPEYAATDDNEIEIENSTDDGETPWSALKNLKLN